VIRRVFESKILRLFSSAVIDQAILSASSLIVGLLLIRHAKAEDYGYYVLAQSAVLLLSSGQGAWISGPIAVLAPKKTVEQRHKMIGAVEAGQRWFLRRVAVVALVMPALGYLFGAWTLLPTLVATAAILAGWTAMQREYLRSVLFIYGRPNTVLAIDSIYVVVLIAGAALATFGPGQAAVGSVLALAAAGGIFSWRARALLAQSPGWDATTTEPVWAELRKLGIWAATGAIIYWFYGQGFNYLLAAKKDVAAVAIVNAARLLLMPTWVLTIGVRALLTPSAASWLHEFGFNALVRKLSVFVVGLLVLFGVYILIVWVFRDWVTSELMRKVIPDRDRLIVLWAAYSIVTMIRDVYLSALLATERFRPMAWLTAASAVTSLVSMWFLIDVFGLAGAVIGLLLGESLSLLGVLVYLVLGVIRARGSSPVHASGH
jgi:O-antigen/teichoic acid export membrane protein